MPLKYIKIAVFYFLLALFFKETVHASIVKDLHTLHKYHFTTPLGLESKVNFWKKIYSEYTTEHVVVHDIENLDIIYEVVYFRNGIMNASRRERQRKLDRIKNKYRIILRQIARTKRPETLNPNAKRVFNLVKSDFRRAANRIRVQIGQKDRFEKGLVKSGLFNQKIKQIFMDANLPVELGILPHVESSFQVNAYSSAGAAGIWQFTRGTGRLFMKVGYDVDERRDPILSTIAATNLLKRNFELLKSWPLAITAYNHGSHGINRAKNKFGGNIVDIINGYRSRTFGFASKNFYAEFLAALEVVQNREKYFPGLSMLKPQQMSSIVFKDYVHINTIMTHFKMTRNEISQYNPALRKPVISGQKRIPRGFIFQTPQNKIYELKNFYQKIPLADRFAGQIRSKWHTVRRGDTLSDISKRFGISVNKIYRSNNLTHRNKIYVGQVLRLPNNRYSGYKNSAKLKRRNINSNYKGELTTYRVARNDNLTKIANRFNTHINILLKLNKIKNPNRLQLGQSLKVPKSNLVAQISASQVINRRSHKIKLPHSKLLSKDLKKTKIKTIEYGDKYVKAINKNRPAFSPVSFSNVTNNSSDVGLITVDFDETLSHYAEWAKLSVNKVLKINGMGSKSKLKVYSMIKVPFVNVNSDTFEERRQEYHKAIQEDFFNNYKIEKLLVKNISKGETVWQICNDIYSIPFWLLASYNPNTNINLLAVGEPIIVPMISPIKL